MLWHTTLSDSRQGNTTHTTRAGKKKALAKRRLTSRHRQVTMVGSTARPGVRRGDVSEEPRRWLLVAVLVASLVSTTRAGCSANGPGVDCVVYGNSQVQSFSRTVLYGYIHIDCAEQKSGGGSERLIIQAEAFKNINVKYIALVGKCFKDEAGLG